MSNTLKQAITALKSRVLSAYDAITRKGGTLPTDMTSGNLPDAIMSIPQIKLPDDEDALIENNDIFFIDHFGIQAAYKKEQVMAWSEIEFTPITYNYLDFYGFTETLEDIQDGRMHTVGVIYSPRENIKCIKIENDNTFVSYSFTGSGNPSDPRFNWNIKDLAIDWGDGERTENVGVIWTGGQSHSHTYKKKGEYIIRVDYGDRAEYLWCTNISGLTLYDYYQYFRFPTNSVGRNRFVCVPPTQTYGSNLLNGAFMMEVFVMPDYATGIGSNFGLGAKNLRLLVLSKSTNSRSGQFLNSIDALKLLDIPDNFSYLAIGLNMKKLKLPKNSVVSSINQATHIKLRKLDLSGLNGLETINFVHFFDKFVVPEGVLSYSQTSAYGAVGELTLPSTLTTLNYTRANFIHIKAITPPTIPASNRVSANRIYVPYSADHSILAAYQSATNWTGLSSIIEEEIP